MREDFYEILSSLASNRITDEDFLVSAPMALVGTDTKVTVVPRDKTNLYGKRTIEYKRYDMSTEAPITLRWRGEQRLFQLIPQLWSRCFFVYRRLDVPVNGVVVPRFLKLSTYDIADQVLPPIFSQTIELHVPIAERSDFFVGQLTFLIKPS